MATTYRGNRCFYIDDSTGKMWDSVNMRQEYDMETNLPVGENPIAVTVDTQTSATSTVTEVIKDPLECEVCGKVAKSKAGLAVHKLSHKG